LARRERREIEEAEIDRLLDLVRAIPGEEHERDVRLEFPHGRSAAQRARTRERVN
jgi:hypothetical protein